MMGGMVTFSKLHSHFLEKKLGLTVSRIISTILAIDKFKSLSLLKSHKITAKTIGNLSKTYMGKSRKSNQSKY
jgi:hypothetical protein